MNLTVEEFRTKWDHAFKQIFRNKDSKEIEDFPGLYEDLYEFFLEDMPYGIQKARTGDPNEYCHDAMVACFESYYTIPFINLYICAHCHNNLLDCERSEYDNYETNRIYLTFTCPGCKLETVFCFAYEASWAKNPLAEERELKKQLILAEKIARKAHEGQQRWNKEPYITHPERIVKALEKDCWPIKTKCVAWLHDVIEDTSITPLDLVNEGVEREIIDSVLAMTRGKDENYAQYIKRVKENYTASIVKQYDIKDNLVGLTQNQRKDKYLLALNILKEVQ